MFSNPETKRKTIRSLIFIIILLIGITGVNYRNNHIKNTETLLLKSDIKIFVQEKPLNGLNENLLCEEYFIEMMGRQIIEDLNNRLLTSSVDLSNNSSDSTRIIDAWYQTAKDKNFVVIKHKYKETINATSIIGIKETKLIRITAYSTACDVPHTYGPCASKMKDIFGFSFKNSYNKHS